MTYVFPQFGWFGLAWNLCHVYMDTKDAKVLVGRQKMSEENIMQSFHSALQITFSHFFSKQLAKAENNKSNWNNMDNKTQKCSMVAVQHFFI